MNEEPQVQIGIRNLPDVLPWIHDSLEICGITFVLGKYNTMQSSNPNPYFVKMFDKDMNEVTIVNFDIGRFSLASKAKAAVEAWLRSHEVTAKQACADEMYTMLNMLIDDYGYDIAWHDVQKANKLLQKARGKQ